MPQRSMQKVVGFCALVTALCAFRLQPAVASQDDQQYRQCANDEGFGWTYVYWHYDCNTSESLEDLCDAAGAYCEFSTGRSIVHNSGYDPLEDDCWVTCFMGN